MRRLFIASAVVLLGVMPALGEITTTRIARSQWKNRQDVLQKFSALIARALRPVKKRAPSRPTHSSARCAAYGQEEDRGAEAVPQGLRRRVSTLRGDLAFSLP